MEDKVNVSRMNIKEFRKGEFEKQLVEEQAKVAEIEKQLEEKEVLLLQRRLETLGPAIRIHLGWPGGQEPLFPDDELRLHRGLG